MQGVCSRRRLPVHATYAHLYTTATLALQLDPFTSTTPNPPSYIHYMTLNYVSYKHSQQLPVQQPAAAATFDLT
jgi:hypothetical protein